LAHPEIYSEDMAYEALFLLIKSAMMQLSRMIIADEMKNRLTFQGKSIG
jgi:hypothetical protein